MLIGLTCAGLFIYHVRKEPRRILCGILLVLALFFCVRGALPLIYPNQPSPEGGITLGAGEETLALLQFIFFVLSFFGGIALFVNGIRLIRKERLSLAHILPCAFGLIAILWPLTYIVIMIMIVSSSDPWVFAQIYLLFMDILMYVPGMLAAVFLYSFVYAALPKPRAHDFILVLGAGLKNGETVTPLLASRLNRGIRAYEVGDKQAVFVVSGGQGANEKVSEAFAMQQYLLEKGIPGEQIVLEDKSTTTEENIRFAKAVMDRIKSDYTCIIATSNYHVLRAVILAKAYGLNAQGVGGRTALYYLPAAFIREYIAIIFGYKKLIAAYIVLVVIYRLLGVIL